MVVASVYVCQLPATFQNRMLRLAGGINATAVVPAEFMLCASLILGRLDTNVKGASIARTRGVSLLWSGH